MLWNNTRKKTSLQPINRPVSHPQQHQYALRTPHVIPAQAMPTPSLPSNGLTVQIEFSRMFSRTVNLSTTCSYPVYVPAWSVSFSLLSVTFSAIWQLYVHEPIIFTYRKKHCLFDYLVASYYLGIFLRLIENKLQVVGIRAPTLKVILAHESFFWDLDLDYNLKTRWRSLHGTLMSLYHLLHAYLRKRGWIQCWRGFTRVGFTINLLRATLSEAKLRSQSRASFCGHIW